MRSKLYSILSVVCLLCLTSCGVDSSDTTYFTEFVKYNSTETKQETLSESVDLFIDYSTCVAEAKKSAYFKATHPSIVDCSPTFYSIKGKSIKKETDNRQQVYNLLSSISEVNHADIKGAVNMIVNGNNQAVLITDGEFYMPGSVRDNLNNPYLAEDFRIWLKKGYDIYFYCEQYVESGRHNKYRYYIIFTDDDIENNINDRFARSCSADDYDVTVFHLSDGKLRVKRDNKYPIINDAVSASENTKVQDGIDFQEYYLSWSDMQSYLTEGDIEYTYILRGLYIDNKVSHSYKIEEITPRVYQLYPEYEKYYNSKLVGEATQPKAGKFKLVKDVFEIDEDTFEETGEIVLKLKSGFDGGDLSYEHPNLLRVDFVVTEAKNNFTRNSDVNEAFIWKSISAAQGHADNTSLYESISQVLHDPKMNPERREVVLYSLYLSTTNY